ncbi:hypothetical protein RND81_09G012200 [Saponaria officinalis]|uniref:F-box domain-containing protein n=1 Tax=Saponaria officinalis TaxID=3572 RepID=A0AAW1IHE7_SAPOF
MEERTRPTLKPCEQKRSKAAETVAHVDDRLSLLPDEILLKIWSHLATMKDAARASLASRKWKHMWLVHPLLNFEDKNLLQRVRTNYKKLIDKERSNFINRVDYIVEHHLGTVIDEFRVAFDLDHENHSHVDKWLDFAFAKQVKRLELVLKRAGSNSKRKPYDMKMPCNFGTVNFKSTLTSLRLESVNVTAEVIDSFLGSFPSLEVFSVRWIHSFTSITACSPLPLKHLEVCYCECLKLIDLCVPHLLSFTYEGLTYGGWPAKLHFRNASSLSAVSIGCFGSNCIAYAFDFLLIYCAQLQSVEVKCGLFKHTNLQINHCPMFRNVKHLTLNVIPDEDASILGWTPLIKACPVLEKLTLNLETPPPLECMPTRKMRKLDAHPLSCLKTLEIVGFLGYCVNRELVMFVIENADILDEMIVDARSPYLRKNSNVHTGFSFEDRCPDLESHKIAFDLLQMLSPSVKLTFIT